MFIFALLRREYNLVGPGEMTIMDYTVFDARRAGGGRRYTAGGNQNP
ncbi:MAG: hypothetical protein GY856_39140 [bacterium]|nr:hypothetical protein [bacterium]